MSEPDLMLGAPATARYNREAIEQIIQSVEDGVFCALLGPRLSGKTLLLRYLENNLARLLGWTCAYIDLQQVRATTQQAFFADLIRLVAEGLSDQTGEELPVPYDHEASSAVFRAYLSDYLDALQRDLVLIIDPLEALPMDMVQALLTSLRAAYMDQQTLDYRVTVVVSGALSLATLTVGESSPFRGIARRVFLGDLSKEDSQALILEYLSEHGVSPTRQALGRLLQLTSGDTYLIRKFSQRCAEYIIGRSSNRLRSREVMHIANRFLRRDVFQYAPLIEGVRLIEEDPDLLECILKLLEQDSVPRSALPLPLSPDLDPLFLTGVVEQVSEDCYRLQNLIYRRFLAHHFSPGRVGHVLAMTGRWDSAINYLEASIFGGNHQSRLDLLPAAINSMYASQDLSQAAHFLRRGLSAAFGVSEAHVWYCPPQESYLQLIGPAEAGLDDELWRDRRIPLIADRLEARACRQQVPLRGHEGEGRVLRAIPLITPGHRPIGVVSIYDELAGDPLYESRERDLQLSGFLNQAARALHTVSIRRQELAMAGRLQASLLPEAPPRAFGWDFAATWRPARETSGDFYDFVALPDGRVGIVIADVVDKGMGAALLMALTRTLLRTYAADYPDQPEQLLQVVNQRIIADMNSGLFVTLFYGVLDLQNSRLTYCNAGHPPPLIFLPSPGEPVQALSRTGIPLGINEATAWERASAEIPPGALLLLYTDGIPDAMRPSGELFGEGRMQAIVQANLGRPSAAIQDTLIASVFAFAESEPQVDDITVMAIGREA